MPCHSHAGRAVGRKREADESFKAGDMENLYFKPSFVCSRNQRVSPALLLTLLSLVHSACLPSTLLLLPCSTPFAISAALSQWLPNAFLPAPGPHPFPCISSISASLFGCQWFEDADSGSKPAFHPLAPMSCLSICFPRFSNANI